MTRQIGYPWICILTGGPTLKMPMGNGRYFTFEMHPYCGPVKVHAKTGEPTKHDFPESSSFWNLFKAWDRGGRIVDQYDRCVLGHRGTA
jgi:hypothetical protein